MKNGQEGKEIWLRGLPQFKYKVYTFQSRGCYLLNLLKRQDCDNSPLAAPLSINTSLHWQQSLKWSGAEPRPHVFLDRTTLLPWMRRKHTIQSPTSTPDSLSPFPHFFAWALWCLRPHPCSAFFTTTQPLRRGPSPISSSHPGPRSAALPTATLQHHSGWIKLLLTKFLLGHPSNLATNLSGGKFSQAAE